MLKNFAEFILKKRLMILGFILAVTQAPRRARLYSAKTVEKPR